MRSQPLRDELLEAMSPSHGVVRRDRELGLELGVGEALDGFGPVDERATRCRVERRCHDFLPLPEKTRKP